MDDICFALNKRTLGDDRHLLCRNRCVTAVDTIPPDCQLVFDDPALTELFKLNLQDSPSFPPRNYIKAYEQVLRTTSIHRVPWKHCIPHKVYSEFVRQLIDEIHDKLMQCDYGYFGDTYQRGNEALIGLEPVKIDAQRYTELSRLDENATLRSFSPTGTGYADPVTYDRTATVTGRLLVKSGPNILHLRKDNRSVLVSRFGNEGAIWSLDYKSLEPRVLLAGGTAMGTCGTIPREIYGSLRDELFFNDKVSRDDVKNIVLSEIYGSTTESISKRMPHVENIEDIVEEIERYFGLQELRDRLFRENESHGRRYICNRYGRRVSTIDAHPYMLINYFIQSTAVDVALQGFGNIVRYLRELGRLDVMVPLFVLHDALILDVHKSVERLLPTLCKVGAMDIPGFADVMFYLQPERFSGLTTN